MVKSEGGVEVKSMIDLVLVKKDVLRFVKDMRVRRGTGETSQTTMFYCVKSD